MQDFQLEKGGVGVELTRPLQGPGSAPESVVPAQPGGGEVPGRELGAGPVEERGLLAHWFLLPPEGSAIALLTIDSRLTPGLLRAVGH